MWRAITLVALLWPGPVAGLLDGAPLDTLAECILLGLVVPALIWVHPAFVRKRSVRAAVAAILLLKIGAAVSMQQQGWCVTFTPPQPMVRDSTGKPHAWDLRADWLSADPACSAIMTRSYRDTLEVPAWFFNLPPPDDAVVRDGYNPGEIPVRIGGFGFLTVPDAGVFAFDTAPLMNAELRVDGTRIDPGTPGRHEHAIGAGVHAIQFEGTLLGKEWRVIPAWNGVAMGSMRFPLATLRSPSQADRTAGLAVQWIGFALVVALIAGWLISLVVDAGVTAVTIWSAVSALAVTLVAIYFPPQAAWYTAAVIAIPLLMPVSRSLQSSRAVFLLIVVPWLAFVAASNAAQVGRWTLYGIGNDNFQFQRFAYRIFMQHYWLEGGQVTFWNQPLFRWIAGLLHMLFGDSSVGQAYWDGAGVAIIAMCAYRIVDTLAGFAWGLPAAMLPVVLFLLGPSLPFVGFGLSEISSAAMIYLAALLAIRNRGAADAVMAGVLATLGFFTRLNNFPMAAAVAVFAVPLTVPIGTMWKPRAWLPLVRWRIAVAVSVSLAIGLCLFAWRTWYYTGVFSVFHGTQRDYLAVWKPGMSWLEGGQAMASSVMMVLTSADPPRFAWYAVPLFVAAIMAIAGLVRVRGFRDAPAPAVLLFLAGCAGALVTRGWAYEGRFSIHLYGAASALIVWGLSAFAQRWGGKLEVRRNDCAPSPSR